MHNLLEDRYREPKKKIFHEQVRGHFAINQSSIEGKSSRQNVQSCIVQQPNLVEDLKKQIQELHNSNIELKTLLKEERQRYDSLFEQYEQLMERNSLIEKEYINLKYEHNRQIKDIKKEFAHQMSQQTEKIVNEIASTIRQEHLHQNTKEKLDKIVQTLKTIPQIKVSREKFTKNHSKRTLQICEQKTKESVLTEKDFRIDSEGGKGPQIEEVDLCTLVYKHEKSPQKEIVSNVQESNEQLEKQLMIFEDQYYGQLEDYNSFQEKVTLRRNYELMRKNNRSSTDIKRKKIFNSGAIF